jgi:outer membrane lipoprotein-sorting protein
MLTNLLITLLAGPSMAAELTPPEALAVVKRVEDHYGKVQTLQAGFVQTIHSPLYGDQVQKGTVSFGRPGKMHWFFEADNKHYINDGSVMWVVLAGDKQAFRYPSGDTSGSPESLLNSLDNMTLLFDVTVTYHGENHTDLMLKPKTEGGFVQVEIRIAPDLSVSRVVVTDAIETRTELSFLDMLADGELAGSPFTYTPEPGIEVIDASAAP